MSERYAKRPIGYERRRFESVVLYPVHITTTTDGKSVTVTLGYDRPLDYVFCTVMQNDNKDGEDILYSNLSDDEAGTDLQNVDYYRPILLGLGISVPDAMFTEVKIDQLERTGNRSVLHTS